MVNHLVMSFCCRTLLFHEYACYVYIYLLDVRLVWLAGWLLAPVWCWMWQSSTICMWEWTLWILYIVVWRTLFEFKYCNQLVYTRYMRMIFFPLLLLLLLRCVSLFIVANGWYEVENKIMLCATVYLPVANNNFPENTLWAFCKELKRR